MEQQVSQRSIKKYMVLFPVLALLVCFVILKGADMESVWNAMKIAKPQWLAAGPILAVVFNIAEAINLIAPDGKARGKLMPAIALE